MDAMSMSLKKRWWADLVWGMVEEACFRAMSTFGSQSKERFRQVDKGHTSQM